jgi:hypothetical protein
LFKVGKINAAGALPTLAPRLRPPETVVGEPLQEIPKCDLRCFNRLFAEACGKKTAGWDD